MGISTALRCVSAAALLTHTASFRCRFVSRVAGPHRRHSPNSCGSTQPSTALGAFRASDCGDDVIQHFLFVFLVSCRPHPFSSLKESLVSRTHLLVPLAIVALAFSSAVRAESTDTYFSVSAGFTRLADSTTVEVLEFEPASDTAVAVAVGSYFGDAARTELQVSYGNVRSLCFASLRFGCLRIWFPPRGQRPCRSRRSFLGLLRRARRRCRLVLLGRSLRFEWWCALLRGRNGGRLARSGHRRSFLGDRPRNAVFGRYTLLHSGGFSAEDRAHMFMLVIAAVSDPRRLLSTGWAVGARSVARFPLNLLPAFGGACPPFGLL